ncbi:hypothetical protein Q0M68_13630, partial [Staphylococcus aureus]|nr:hypothetical protein [Staphylococcus aureus]
AHLLSDPSDDRGLLRPELGLLGLDARDLRIDPFERQAGISRIDARQDLPGADPLARPDLEVNDPPRNFAADRDHMGGDPCVGAVHLSGAQGQP